MNRFDYLHDALPEVVEAVRSMRLPRRYYGVVTALMALCTILVGGTAIERVQVDAALAEQHRAQIEFDRSRSVLQSMQLHWNELDALIARDRRLRDIRLSGPRIASRLARMGNALPERAWLTSMTTLADSYALQGRATDLHVFGSLVGDLLRDPAILRPHLVRVSRDDRSGRS
ncbi:MAG TPA: hypothetical protein VNG31_09800, partial [Candidatus Baltobacteraceae bacterium]|nr:hypothetical protein [Candidatus Baltobacteraceae bacterium]